MKHALLIGSQTGGLKGVHHDVDRMADALGARDFELRLCKGEQASRDGILDAYQKLIDDARADDVVCVYYAGHGNLAFNPEYRPGGRLPQDLQYLIPTDDTPEEFRGVMGFELSYLLARLTEKTRNVTVILDCCHSARLSRAAQDLRLRARAGTGRASEAQVRALLQKSVAPPAAMDVESNPHAVRLVAAEANSIAYERVDEQGNDTGVFTEALTATWAEVGSERVSWAALMSRVRELVMARIPEQRPDVEGPRRRQLWATDEVPEQRALSLYFNGSEPRIRGGALLGVVPGATYGVMPARSEAYAAERALGTAVVEESLGTEGRVRLEPAGLGAGGQTGLLAFPLSVPFRRLRVALGAGLPPELGTRLAAGALVTPVEARGGEVAPTVLRDGANLVLQDAQGELVLKVDEGGLDALVDRLERLARAEALRLFEPGQLDVDLDVSFGRIVNGERLPLREGEALHVGDFQYLSVLNDDLEGRAVYVAVLGIDAACDVFLLSRRAPRGQRLEPGKSLVLGEDARGELLGAPVSWPSSLPPRGSPRRESIIVLATRDEQDFTLLTTSGRTRGGPSLERVLEQIRGGGARTRGGGDAAAQYLVRRLDYQLDPSPRS